MASPGSPERKPNYAKNLTRSVKDAARGGFAPNKISKKRLDLCLECKFFQKVRRQCLQCGCFMDIKTRMALAKCPIGKWDAYTERNSGLSLEDSHKGTSLSSKRKRKLED